MSSKTKDVYLESGYDDAFWYKGQGCLLSGLPGMLEGGIPARSAAEALQKVKKMSGLWSFKRLHTIYIYKLGNGGEIPDSPEIVYNASNQSLQPRDWQNIHTHMKEYADSKKKEPSLLEQYEEAQWTTKFDSDTVYPTVTMKE